MASNNRANLINKAIKVLKRHFKPMELPKDRTLFEHLLLACCLENSLYEPAEEVYQHLNNEYFDWNEVRVSSVRELASAMKPLNDPNDSAVRLKRVLQSVFETHYSFDLETLKKQNIGQTVKQLEKFNGTTPFIVAFVTQNALGGHSIPVNRGLLEAMRIVGVISDSEAAKGSIPGLERAVPKTKGIEISTILHQLGVEVKRSPLGPNTRKYLLEIDPECKSRLPKRTSKKPKEEPEPKAAPSPKKTSKKTEPAKKSEPTKKAAATTKEVKKKAPKNGSTKTGASASPKKKVAKKKPVKKATKKVVKKKKVKSSTVKKKSNKRLAKRKPK